MYPRYIIYMSRMYVYIYIYIDIHTHSKHIAYIHIS